jgi:mono/diheme cytochrome c family protein
MTTRRKLVSSITAAMLLFAWHMAFAQQANSWAKVTKQAGFSQIARGRYIARIAGCNDCHTPGYTQSGGEVPEARWLMGNSLGFRGAWGTTYPANLRLFMHSVSEEQWVSLARAAQSRSPMPWFTLREMSEADLRALYQFVRHLGPAGKAAQAYLSPDQEPEQPYVLFPQPQK